MSYIGSPVVDDPSNNIKLEIGAYVRPFLDWPSHRDSNPGIGLIISRGPRDGIAVVKWTKFSENNNIKNEIGSTTTSEHRVGAGGAYELVYCEAPPSSSSSTTTNSSPPPPQRLETEQPTSFQAAQQPSSVSIPISSTTSFNDEDVTSIIHSTGGRRKQTTMTSSSNEEEKRRSKNNNDDDDDDGNGNTRHNNNNNNFIKTTIPSCMVDPNDDLLDNEENLKKVSTHPTATEYGVVFAQKLSTNCWVKPGIDWKGRPEENEKKGITIKQSSKSPGKVVVKWLNGRTAEHACGANDLFELSYCEPPTGSDCFAVPHRIVTESNCTAGSYVVTGPDWKWGTQDQPGGVGLIIKAGGDGWVLVKFILSGYQNSFRLAKDLDNYSSKCADLMYISREEALDRLEAAKKKNSLDGKQQQLEGNDRVDDDEQTVAAVPNQQEDQQNHYDNQTENKQMKKQNNNKRKGKGKDVADSSDDDSRSFGSSSSDNNSNSSSDGSGIDADDDDHHVDDGYAILALRARERMRASMQKSSSMTSVVGGASREQSVTNNTALATPPVRSSTFTDVVGTHQSALNSTKTTNETTTTPELDTSSFIPEPKEHLAGQLVTTLPQFIHKEEDDSHSALLYCDDHWVCRGPDWKYSDSEFKGGGVTLRTENDGYVWVKWLNTSTNTGDSSSSSVNNNNNIRRFRAGIAGAFDLCFCKKSESGYIEKKQYMLHAPEENLEQKVPRTAALLLPTSTTKKQQQQKQQDPTEYRPKWSQKVFKYYCGLRYCTSGGCACKTCDGYCGPTNGCQCPFCSSAQVTRFCGSDFFDEEDHHRENEEGDKKSLKTKICGPFQGLCPKCYYRAFPMVSPSREQQGETTTTSSSLSSSSISKSNRNKKKKNSSPTSAMIMTTTTSSTAGFSSPSETIPLPDELKDLPHTIIYDESSFKIIRKIGRGGGGDVYEAELVANKARVAIKIFSDTSIDLMTGAENPFWLENVKECKRLFNLNHKNIIKFIGIFVCTTPDASNSAYLKARKQNQQERRKRNKRNNHKDPNGMTEESNEEDDDENDDEEDDDDFTSSSQKFPLQLGMIMELAETNLHSLLMDHQQKFKKKEHNNNNNNNNNNSISYYSHLLPPATIESYALQIASGLEYLHSVRTLWLDSKPQNVLVLNDSQILRLADFGLSQIMSGEASVTRAQSPGAGTYRYMAPELVYSFSNSTSDVEKSDNNNNNNNNNVAVVSPKTDIYSFGCVLFFLLTNEQPWEQEFGHHLRTVPNQNVLTPLSEQVKTKFEEYRSKQSAQNEVVDGSDQARTDDDEDENTTMNNNIVNNNKTSIVVETTLPDQYLVELCSRCLSLDPKSRPSAREIVKAIKLKNAFPPPDDDDDNTKKKSSHSHQSEQQRQQSEDGEAMLLQAETSETFRAFGSDDTNYQSAMTIPLAMSASFGTVNNQSEQ